MKTVISILLLTLMSIQAQARGVLLQCWYQDYAQTEENIIYQTDGNYIHQSLLAYDGELLDISGFRNTEHCISWDLPHTCSDTIELSTGTVEIHLKQKMTFGDGTEGLMGDLYEVEMHEIYCKRRVL